MRIRIRFLWLNPDLYFDKIKVGFILYIPISFKIKVHCYVLRFGGWSSDTSFRYFNKARLNLTAPTSEPIAETCYLTAWQALQTERAYKYILATLKRQLWRQKIAFSFLCWIFSSKLLYYALDCVKSICYLLRCVHSKENANSSILFVVEKLGIKRRWLLFRN